MKARFFNWWQTLKRNIQGYVLIVKIYVFYHSCMVRVKIRDLAYVKKDESRHVFWRGVIVSHIPMGKSKSLDNPDDQDELFKKLVMSLISLSIKMDEWGIHKLNRWWETKDSVGISPEDIEYEALSFYQAMLPVEKWYALDEHPEYSVRYKLKY